MIKKRKRGSFSKSRVALTAFLLAVFAGSGFFFRAERNRLGLGRLNFVLLDSQNEPVIFSLAEDLGVILTLPAGDRIKVPHGFEAYELRKVYPLGELEKKGGQLIKETVEELTAIPVFGYFKSEKPLNLLLSRPREFLAEIFRQAVLGKIRTDLGRYELIRVYLKVRKIPEEKISVSNFKGSPGSLFEDKQIRKEALAVAVFNATANSGFAQKTRDLLTTAGFRIVRVGDAENKQTACLILVARKEFFASYTLKWLRTKFSCQAKMADNETYRADLTLLLGEENWKTRWEKW